MRLCVRALAAVDVRSLIYELRADDARTANWATKMLVNPSE
jgi:hypothetical protein